MRWLCFSLKGHYLVQNCIVKTKISLSVIWKAFGLEFSNQLLNDLGAYIPLEVNGIYAAKALLKIQPIIIKVEEVIKTQKSTLHLLLFILKFFVTKASITLAVLQMRKIEAQ